MSFESYRHIPWRIFNALLALDTRWENRLDGEYDLRCFSLMSCHFSDSLVNINNTKVLKCSTLRSS